MWCVTQWCRQSICLVTILAPGFPHNTPDLPADPNNEYCIIKIDLFHNTTYMKSLLTAHRHILSDIRDGERIFNSGAGYCSSSCLNFEIKTGFTQLHNWMETSLLFSDFVFVFSICQTQPKTNKYGNAVYNIE